MNTRLLKLELAMLVRERHLLWMVVGVALLLVVSFATVSIEILRNDAAKHGVAAQERERWLNQGEKDPHSAAHYSIYAFKPAPVLAALDPGVEPFVGQTVWLEAHAQNDMLHRPKGEAGALQRAGLLNPAALLTTLAPVVAFVLAFVVVARDRERGTLRLALGAALKPTQILSAKVVVIWGVMVMLLVAPVSLAAAVMSVLHGTFGADAALRVAAWALVMSLYLGLMALLGITIATVLKDVRLSFAAMFCVWIVLSIGMPRALTNAVDGIRPLPQTQAIKQQLQSEAPAYWSAEVSKSRQDALLAKYGVSRKEDLPIDERGAQLNEAERHSHEVFDRVLGAFYDQVQAQDRLFSSFGFLSPTVAAQSLSATLSGTDFTHHRTFIEQAEAYRRNLVNRMNGEVMNHPLNDGGPRHFGGPELWSSIAAFSYVSPSLPSTWRNSAPAAGAMLVWLVVAGACYAAAVRGIRP